MNKSFKFKVISLIRLVIYLIKIFKKKYILLDTPLHGNLGDQAIAIAEIQMLERLNIKYAEITVPEFDQREKLFSRFTSKNKIILVHGGGFLGELWTEEEERFRRILEGFKNNKIIVFPQTVTFSKPAESEVFQKSRLIYQEHKDLHILLRDKKSFKFMNEYMSSIDVQLVPDIVMGLSYEPTDRQRKGILLCLRNDKERKISQDDKSKLFNRLSRKFLDEKIEYIDTVVNKNISCKEREDVVREKLVEFEQCRLIITDRLHGLIFAALTTTPCIAIANTNGKVEGAYEWLKENKYIKYANSFSDIFCKLDELQLDQSYKYLKPVELKQIEKYLHD